MKIHILGVGGTFMGSLAILATKAGITVSGQDQKIYPPMSTQLQEQGIVIIEGYGIEDLPSDVDYVVIGNVMRRGMPIIEHILNQKIPYISGPELLEKYIIHDKHVLVVSGTHGKTTTASMLAWILEYAGLQPGYLIGGIPNNFAVSAALGASEYFVVEGDEYDCAFFDKRSKFLHYRPQTLIINNIEYDHADIFKDIDAIYTQFHHLLRIVPGDGLIVYRDDDQHINKVLDMGYWSNKIAFNSLDLQIPQNIVGAHNQLNAKAAILAAQNVGVAIPTSLEALAEFAGVKRRLELKATFNEVAIYSDFAHHPTAIKTTIDAVPGKRVIAIIDLCSNTMRAGLHQDTLKDAAAKAAQAFFYSSETLDWEHKLGVVYHDQELLRQEIIKVLQPGDSVVLMSNGAFESFSAKLAGV